MLPVMSRAAAGAGAGRAARPHGPQHRRRGGRPARPVARRHRARAGRSASSPAGTVSASSSRPTARAPPSSSTGSMRWRKSSTGRSWCGWSRAPTGTPRSSARRRSGLTGYPVFTRKANTDVSYIANARKLLSMTDRIYPQFATHNAHTVAAILDDGGQGPRQLRVPAPARHGRGAARDGAQGRRHALPHLCAGRRAFRPARLSGAPAARERRQLVLRPPDHRRGCAGRRRSPAIRSTVVERKARPPTRRSRSRPPSSARAAAIRRGWDITDPVDAGSHRQGAGGLRRAGPLDAPRR